MDFGLDKPGKIYLKFSHIEYNRFVLNFIIRKSISFISVPVAMKGLNYCFAFFCIILWFVVDFWCVCVCLCLYMRVISATRLLPVLLLCPLPAVKAVLSCMETTASDWAHVVQGKLQIEEKKHKKTKKNIMQLFLLYFWWITYIKKLTWHPLILFFSPSPFALNPFNSSHYSATKYPQNLTVI